MKYFLDTYALIEIIRGNKAYVKYLDDKLFTSILNLYELYYNLLKSYTEEEAKKFYDIFSDFLITINDNHIFCASQFKLQRIKSEISCADALGYAIAKTESMKFLTGDKEFRTLDNVEFVR